MWRTIASLFPSIGLLVAAFYMAPLAAKLPAEQVFIIKILPLVIAIPFLLLVLRFNRSRLFFSTLSVILLYLVLVWVLPQQTAVNGSSIYQLASLLAPLNLLIFSELKERGVFTGWGGIRFMILLAPIIIGWWLFKYQAAWLNSLLTYRFMPDDLLGWKTFAQPAQISGLLVFLIMNGRLFAQPDVQRSALFGGLIGLFLVLHYPGNIYIVSVFTTAVIAMFVVALIQDSWNMAYVDHLTGLPGRRALNERLLKLSGTYAIAMLDVDHFKKFNDTYGHEIGDEVLRMVASRVREVGSGGKAYRYGGEEFSIVFSGRQVDEVRDSLEEVREHIAETKFQPQRMERRETNKNKKSRTPKEVQVTISIGVAEHDEKHAEPNDVIGAADRALYRAKKKGRNQVSQ